MTAKLEGVARFNRNMAAVKQAVRDDLDEATEAAGMVIRDRAQELGSQISRRGADDIELVPDRRSRHRASALIGVRERSFWMTLWETGTRFIPMKSWLRAAFREKHEEATMAFRRRLLAGIRRRVR